MINWLKSAGKSLIYRGVEMCVRPSASITPNTMLLIRTDAIGDYVLFRNFIRVLKQSSEFGDYDITLVGNTAWRELAERFDSEYISRFIWIDRTRFDRSPRYRYKILRQIAATGYSVLLNPIFSRSYNHSDCIARIITADEKIAHEGDRANISAPTKAIADKYYTRLIPAPDTVMFEFYQNRRFIERILDQSIDLRRPELQTDSSESRFELPAPFAVLFIGASSPKRKWPINKFVELARRLSAEDKLGIVLLGGPEDKPAALEFESLSPVDCTNLVGKTSIIEYMEVLAACDLLISNETSAPHLAQALGEKPTVVIYSGKHFGRFTPYPEEIANHYRVALHPVIAGAPAEYQQRSNSGTGAGLPAIDDISVDDVYSLAQSLLSAW